MSFQYDFMTLWKLSAKVQIMMIVDELGRRKRVMNKYAKDQKLWMNYGFDGKFVYFVYLVNILWK